MAKKDDFEGFTKVEMVNEGLTPAAMAALAQGDMANAMRAMTPGGIEAQEAEGQRTLVTSAQLPTKGTEEYRAGLEAIGFVFGEKVDDLFTEVTLPPGWTKKATDHDLHSDLLDNKGRKRAGIFYKAAFYDRRADIHWTPRFLISTKLQDEKRSVYDIKDGEEVPCCAVVYDHGTEIFRTDYLPLTNYYGKHRKNKEVVKQNAAKWLAERYPNHEQPFAHWDD